jgi:hypothetical protein
MPDIGSIAVGLSSIKTALDITKDFRNIDNSFKNAEMKSKLIDLMDALSDAKLALYDVRDENLELREQIKTLKEKLTQKDEIIFRDGHYYRAEAVEGKPDGPFCSNCYSDNEKLILLESTPGGLKRLGKYLCPKCNRPTN